MGYMQIATKNVQRKADKKLLTDQTDQVLPTKKVAKAQQPVNKVAKAVNPNKVAKVLPSTNNPVPGTPYAALTSLMKNRK